LKNNFFIKSVFFLSLIFILLLPGLTAVAGDNDKHTLKKGYITVTDCAGRKVPIPRNVERIACLYLFAGHVVTMLGRGDDIVAVSNGLKRVSLLPEICQSIKNATVPKSQGALNMEELLKADPDVLFIAGEMSGNRDEMEKLERFGIPAIIIDYSDMQSQQKAISIIGKTIGREKRAEEYNNYFRKIITQVKSQTDRLQEDKRLRLYYSENEATRTTLDNDLSTDWLSITGVINVAHNNFGSILEGKHFAGIEQIILWNPEVILANEPEALSLMITDKKWAAIDAVKNKRVYQMPIAISRWGHPGSIETPLAILWASKKMYPSLFTAINMERETKNYYKTFFNYELTEEKVKMILSGELLRKPKHNPEGNRKEKTGMEN
jgi:iron complex transport system substrate-binding protein